MEVNKKERNFLNILIIMENASLIRDRYGKDVRIQTSRVLFLPQIMDKREHTI